MSDVYGVVSSLGSDPIEKKPLYHFYPGSEIVSVGSFGCNLSCKFCQNHEISQVTGYDVVSKGKHLSPELIVRRALSTNNNIGLAFTYNEPTVWHEFMFDIASMSAENNLKNVMVTNGFINPGALEEVMDVMDAFNIDIKSFSNSFYKEQTGGRLKPVLNTIKTVSEAGKHLELTMLIIPGLNDDQGVFSKCIEWISDNCGRDSVLHLSRYFPRYKSNEPVTPGETLESLSEIALEKLDYVYLGNINSTLGKDTKCPGCGTVVTTRYGYDTIHVNIKEEGYCKTCNTQIYKHFIS